MFSWRKDKAKAKEKDHGTRTLVQVQPANGSSGSTNPTMAFASSPVALFPAFPRLPTEIRLKIWAHALPVRILPVRLTSPLVLSSSTVHFTCQESPPVLLSVCRESRYETLRCYTLVSDTHKHSRSRPGHRFYFNPYLDTIFLDASTRVAVEWLRILRVIESHSRILSLALRNAHWCPQAFAIEVTSRKGVREMFVVGTFEEYGWVPDFWALLPRRRGAGLMGGEGYCGSVVECIESWECAYFLPNVTAVKEEYFRRKGLEVVGRW